MIGYGHDWAGISFCWALLLDFFDLGEAELLSLSG